MNRRRSARKCFTILTNILRSIAKRMGFSQHKLPYVTCVYRDAQLRSKKRNEACCPNVEKHFGTIFLTGGVREESSSVLLRKIVFINSFLLVILISLALFGMLHLLAGSYAIGLFEVLCSLIALGDLVFFRRSGNLELSCGPPAGADSCGAWFSVGERGPAGNRHLLVLCLSGGGPFF